jgi:5,5'-dehydrodivanillate O-demethylase
MHAFQIRVPVDDVTTAHYWYTAFIPPEGVTPPAHMTEAVASFDFIYRNPDGTFKVELVDGQDIMAWCTPGPILDRTKERLAWTDRGLIQYRGMLFRALEAIKEGRDPLGVLRDPARDKVIHFPLESGRAQFEDGFASLSRRLSWCYYPQVDELIELFTRSKRLPQPATV